MRDAPSDERTDLILRIATWLNQSLSNRSTRFLLLDEPFSLVSALRSILVAVLSACHRLHASGCPRFYVGWRDMG